MTDLANTPYEGMRRSGYSRMVVTAFYPNGSLEVISICLDETSANQMIDNCSKLERYKDARLGYVGYRVWESDT